MNNIKTDIVLYWVDSEDPEWIDQKNKMACLCHPEEGADSNIRFESWDNLKYWFRAIEKCMPWFNKIFFITCGHKPDFLDLENSRIRFVTHDEFIPKEYLPTFNSSTIEMNLFRIEDLSENFVLFNDDTFPLKPIEEDYFFKDDKACDEAVENIITTSSFGPVSNMARYFQVNNMFIINKYFKKRKVQAEHPEQWFNKEYGERLERTESLKYWNDFPGFYDPHLANALKKSTFAKIWKLENEKLEKASRNRFRAHNDLTQYLIRYWQLCEGDFYPRPSQGKVFFVDMSNYKEVADAIRHRDYQMVSINESVTEDEFSVIRDEINAALEKVFPEKCSFEK